MLRRLFCLFSAFAVLFFCSVPAFATGVMPSGVAGIPVVGEIQLDVVEFAELCRDDMRGTWNFFAHLLDEDICPSAPQVNGGHSFVPKRTMVDGQIGKYYVCEYCGRAYGEMLEEKYEEYVETLPGQTYNSDGSFLWVMTVDSLLSVKVRLVSNGSSFNDFYMDGSVHCSVGLGGSQIDAHAIPCEQIVIVTSKYDVELNDVYFCAPYDGYYELVSPGYRFVARNCALGSFYSLGDGSSYPYMVAKVSRANPSLSWPVFRITPFSTVSGFSGDTRVGEGVSDSGTRLYGYVQAGQLYQSTVGNIYNETTNVYQNPVTGETKDVSNWTYDYSDRSYTLNTEEGDTVTVIYGDTNVIISEGGMTYNVYYLAEHEDISDHDYVSSVTLEPTCVATGVRTYTCTDCGQTYTVSIPATGHTWQVVRTVPTTFDEDGQLVTEGYTLYECSTCHEQYKLSSDSGGSSLPAPSESGASTGGGSLVEIDSGVGKGFLATIAHGLTEDLPEVLELVSQWFTKIPKLYDGYSKFLAASFAWMPSDCVMLLTFGVGMVVALAICRAMFRR